MCAPEPGRLDRNTVRECAHLRYAATLHHDREVRERLGLLPGQKLNAIAFGDGVELIPVRPPRERRGFLKGIDTDVEREADRQ
ncbi:MAG: AbrB/MazE/SpoVT family DNA-binding domain-containing protein [Gammaproteobacteria bacterium]|nr:AbrB/MazE/SpoVT family DNA-binding domain-containing protein [Gammaproteobacteria bacterium]MDE0248411.1 AbrB/MazE/SpoVT family DNA-binding domain-containing protein [Gammaproteobacteria bacterium]